MAAYILRIGAPIPPDPATDVPAVTSIQARIGTGIESDPGTWTFGTPFTLPGVVPGDYAIDIEVGEFVQARCLNAVDADPDNWSDPLWLSAPALNTYTVPLQLTSGVAAVSVDLDVVSPPDAPTTWSYSLVAPGTGQALAGPVYTLSGIGTSIATGEYSALRTRSDDGLDTITLDVTVVSASLVVDTNDWTFSLLLGADDPDDTAYTITATTDPAGGPYDGVDLTFTRAALDAAAGGGPALVLGSGIIELDTDSDSDGEVDEDDVVRIARKPLWSPASITVAEEWEIDGVLTGETGETFTRGAGVTGTNLRRRFTPSVGSPVVSNALTLAQAAPSPLDIEYVADLQLSASTAGTLSRTYQFGALAAGTYFIPMYQRIGAPYGVTNATLGGVDCVVPQVGANEARRPLFGQTATDHLVFWMVTLTEANSGEFTVNFTEFTPNDGVVALYRITGGPVSVLGVQSSFSNHAAAPWSTQRTVPTADGGMTLVGMFTGIATDFDDIANFTIERQLQNSTRRVMIGRETPTPEAATRTYRFGDLNQPANNGCISIAVSLARV